MINPLTMNIAQDTTTLPARIAIFGSGTGSNARALVTWSRTPSNAAPYTVNLIVSTSATAGIVTMAAELDLPVLVLEKTLSTDEQTRRLVAAFEHYRIDAVALAGYLRRIEPEVINAVHGHVLNIHPSLLPKYGGRGMYGAVVHRAVLDSGDAESGATVHIVNTQYDEGQILAQERVAVQRHDTVDDLAKRVLGAEHRLYPTALADYIRTTVYGSASA